MKDAAELDPLLRRRYDPKVAQSRLSICPEILTPVDGEEYLWYKPRLPSYIKPVNYNLELMFSNINLELYNGYVVITFDITESAKEFLFHTSGNDVPLTQYFQDNTDTEIEIECVGVFLDRRNDYFVVRTTKYVSLFFVFVS